VTERGTIEEFSLLGGPLHRLGRRLGLVRGGTNTVALGLALGLVLWGVLIVLAFAEGVSQQLFALSVIGGHVRLLLVIPLFFLCESFFDPRVTAFVQTIVRSGIVPRNALPTLESEIARCSRLKDSWLAEAICLLAAVLLSLLGPQLQLSGATATPDTGRVLSDLILTGQWYWIVCLTLFRFLMLRWLWRLGLWCYFLWRVSRLPLKLVPTHPDYAAGLGYLEVVQTHFTPLVLAISALQSASLAEELAVGGMSFEEIYPSLALVLVVNAVLFLGPLFIFAPRLWACRMKSLSDYMVFGSSYVGGFERKWLGAKAPPREPLLGTPDLQSLADLGNSIEVVRAMRWVPMSTRLVRDLAVAAVLPMLPLLLFKYPITELVQKFFTRLSGL
jgi:hypothetical protein